MSYRGYFVISDLKGNVLDWHADYEAIDKYRGKPVIILQSESPAPSGLYQHIVSGKSKWAGVYYSKSNGVFHVRLHDYKTVEPVASEVCTNLFEAIEKAKELTEVGDD